MPKFIHECHYDVEKYANSFLNRICFRALIKKIYEFLCKIMFGQRMHLYIRIYKYVYAQNLSSLHRDFFTDSARVVCKKNFTPVTKWK